MSPDVSVSTPPTMVSLAAKNHHPLHTSAGTMHSTRASLIITRRPKCVSIPVPDHQTQSKPNKKKKFSSLMNAWVNSCQNFHPFQNATGLKNKKTGETPDDSSMSIAIAPTAVSATITVVT